MFTTPQTLIKHGSVFGEHSTASASFIVLLLLVGLYAVVFWHYFLGHRAGLWSAKAEKQWANAGRVFAALITVGLMLAIIRFHTSEQAL